MEKQPMKPWKKILIAVIVILVVLVALVARRAIILSNLDKKASEYEDKQNIYIKTTIKKSKMSSQMERYIYNDIDKIVVEGNTANGSAKLTQIVYPTMRKFYTEKDDKKEMSVYEENAPVRGTHIENNTDVVASYSVIPNYAYAMNTTMRIIESILNNVKIEVIDGTQYYVISGLYNTNYIYSENTKGIKVYINKETGLTSKVVEKVEEDGQLVENVTTYEYSFDTVTEEDVAEPDESQYELKTNN